MLHYAAGAASITPEDGVSQADVDTAVTAAIEDYKGPRHLCLLKQI